MEKKVLLVNEASTFKSGLGKYGLYLLKGLQERGFKVAELAFGKYVNPSDDGHITWPVYYNNVLPDDDRYAEMSKDPDNKFGKWRLASTALHFQPDYVLSITDPWHSKFLLTDPTRRYYNLIMMPTADTFPLKPKWYASYTSPDAVLSYSHWAADNLNKMWPGIVKGVARYGVDTQSFYPLDREKIRAGFDLSSDIKIIGMVGKNQPRKLYQNMFQIFSEVLKTHPNTFLHIHTAYPDRISWYIPNMLDQYKVGHRVLFTYTCMKCKQYYPSLYKGEVSICKKCHQRGSMVKCHRFVIDEDGMNNIFNSWDIYYQCASSEGAGMPVAEAACSGLLTVVNDTTAMRDYKDLLNSVPVPVNDMYSFQEQGFRGFPKLNEAVEIFNGLLDKSREELKDMGQSNLVKAKLNYSWDRTCDVWEQVINQTEPKKLWMSEKVNYQEPNFDKITTYPQLINLFQDYFGVNDPYNIISMVRKSSLEEFNSNNSLICDVNKQEIMDKIKEMVKVLTYIEYVRVGEHALTKEDFIDYAEIKELVHARY